MNTKQEFVEILDNFMAGKITADEALEAVGKMNFDMSADSKTARVALNETYHELSHYCIDSDIRAKEPEYGAAQLARIQKWLAELKKTN